MGLGTLNKLAASPIQTPSTPEQYNALVDALTGTIISRDPTTGVETDGAYDIGETSNGRPRNVNFTGDLIQAGNVVGVAVPVGAIIAWHKSLPGVPATLPANFHECDGTVISEPLSPMNGQTLPDLNGQKRFLRGGETSGAIQANQNRSGMLFGTVTSQTRLQDYINATGEDIIYGSSTTPYGSGGYGYVFKRELTDGSLDPNVQALYVNTVGLPVEVSIPAGTPDESRPDNISMVYIMRIF